LIDGSNAFFTSIIDNNFCWFGTDSLRHDNFVNITHYDSINQIISGTFSFKAIFSHAVLPISKEDSLIIKDVTEGRFDLKYQTE